MSVELCVGSSSLLEPDAQGDPVGVRQHFVGLVGIIH